MSFMESLVVAGVDAEMFGHSYWLANYHIADFMTRG
jgi:hypothetical protein